MIERKYVKTQAIEDRRVFVGSSWLNGDSCVLQVARG